MKKRAILLLVVVAIVVSIGTSSFACTHPSYFFDCFGQTTGSMGVNTHYYNGNLCDIRIEKAYHDKICDLCFADFYPHYGIHNHFEYHSLHAGNPVCPY